MQRHTLIRWFSLWLLALSACAVWAQSEEIETGFRRLDPVEEQRQRAVLAAPVPQGVLSAALEQHFLAKERAADLLGDDEQREAILRQAITLFPDAGMRNRLAALLIGKGQFDEGLKLRRDAIAAAAGNPYFGAFLAAELPCDLLRANRYDEARASFAEVSNRNRGLEAGATQSNLRNTLFRAVSLSHRCLSSLEGRLGRHAQAIAAASTAEQYGRRALGEAGSSDQTRILVTKRNLASDIKRRLHAYLDAGRLQDAERMLADAIRYSGEVQLPPAFQSGLYADAGDLRFTQREFARAEQLMRKSDAVLEQLGWAPLHPLRTAKVRDIVKALSGQRRWAEALRHLEQLDAAAGEDARLKSQVRFSFDRAVVYMGNRRYAEAAPLFFAVARANATRHGEGHISVAEANGLRGAALWKAGGGAQRRATAIPLLNSAVRDFMSPVNIDYMENIGLRKELREIIFAAYLEAMAATPSEDAVQTLGAADWVRGGIVQDALGDAAVRAAASTPALADVVRKEQDAKNEVAGLRRYLSGEAGGAASPLPVIAAQMRERIAVLEAERAKLQAEIKAKFPDYDRLVRPTPPSVQDVARQLEPQQALLMLLPTSDAVYAWAVASDRPASFVRVTLPETQLNGMVAGLRRDLDFANGASVGAAYDSASAFALYDKLLAPLASTWQGKTQLVIAAGGALSQLPFSVLQTRAGGGFDASAPWLVKEASITQVPSLSSWLAIKSIARARSAAQAFAGWGDPVFGPKAALSATLRKAQARSITLTRASTLADLEHPEKTTAIPSALKYAEIPALPDTREELLAIAATLQADPQRDLFLGARATRESVLAASKSGQLATKRVIAFATHGLMAGDLPNLTQPALAMAATGTEDKNPFAPLLTLEDVLTLKLNADWVVLSACNTAAADGKAEEALSGLARGFFYAGSRSLLVTHWAVESESAKELTTSTFAHYAANLTAPKAESLRQAMLKVMGMPQFSHPAYWAPYALVGDGGR